MKRQQPPGQLRIIGGKWRGRKLDLPAHAELRPTPDRVRETLFNWLQHVISGARCLDLFAGSGALALESLSRGAASVLMVEREALVVAQLRAHLMTLKVSSEARIIQADALTFLRGPHEVFDLVFLDPPFRHNLLQPCAQLLTERGWLAPAALIYLEAEREAKEPLLPEQWQLLRSKYAGQVGYHLAQYQPELAP